MTLELQRFQCKSNVLQYLAKFPAEPLNHFSGPGSLDPISDPRALPNRAGTCWNTSGVFFAFNLYVEVDKTIEPIRSKHLGILTILGVLLPAFRGEHIFEKRTQDENVGPPTVTSVLPIKFDST